MGMLLLAGPKANLLARGTLSLSGVSSSSLFPLTQICNGDPGDPWWAAAAGSPAFKLDGNEVLNGGFDADLSSWTEVASGGGASSRTTTAGEYNTGPGALKLTPGGGSVYRYQDIVVRAGEVRTVEVWLKNGTGTVTARLRDLTRGYYLRSDGTWQAGSTAFATGTGSYAATTRTLTVPTIATLGVGLVTLRLELTATGGTGFVDDVAHWAAQDFLSVHGHSFGPGVTLAVESSTDGSSWSAETITLGGVVRPIAFFAQWAQRNRRWFRYTFTDAVAVDPLAIGELFAGQALSLARPPLWGDSEDESTPQTRESGPGGEEWAIPAGPGAARQVRLQMIYDWAIASERDELRAELRRCRHGADTLVLVPNTTRLEVLFGRVAPAWGQTYQVGTIEGGELVIRELPGPVYTA